MDGAQSWAEVGERVAEARQAAGLSQGELADRIGLDRTKIVRVESGDRRVTALELFQLAEALGVPLAHFVSRPPASLVSRRAPLEENADEASRARFRLDALLEAHARNAQWLVANGFLRPPTVAEGLEWPVTRDPVAMAETARRMTDCTSGPLGPLADVAEVFGLYLTVVNEPAEGASLLLDGYGAAVISGQADHGRRSWTAAHELGHHLMEDEYHTDAGVAASKDEREQEIDRFAEEFLLPSPDFCRSWQRVGAESTARDVLIELAASYRLSWSAVINKARRLEALDATAARRLKAQTPVKGDFLAVLGATPKPDLTLASTGTQWRRAVLDAWHQGAITAARTVELLYDAIGVDDLPSRDLEDCLL